MINKKEKNELRKLPIKVLNEKCFNLGQERFKLEAQHSTHQLTATHRLKAVKRMLARLLTILHETIGQKV